MIQHRQPWNISTGHLFATSVNVSISHTVLTAEWFCFYNTILLRYSLKFLVVFVFLHMKNVCLCTFFCCCCCCFLKDDSITQATGRASENFSDYNPFSAMEMVSSSVQLPMWLLFVTAAVAERRRHSFSRPVQGKHTDTTIPMSAASSQPAILQTSVEQSPKVSPGMHNLKQSPRRACFYFT